MAPRINDPEKQDLILKCIAAGMTNREIHERFKLRKWRKLSDGTLSYYRRHYGKRIAELKEQRQSQALTAGLALKEERVAALKQQAEDLAQIMWQPDKNGRLWNEKSYRDVLEQIRKEVEGDEDQTPSHIIVEFAKPEDGTQAEKQGKDKLVAAAQAS